MSLSELSVALLIVLVIGGAVVGLTHLPQQAIEQQIATAELHQRVRTALAQLTRDITNAGLPASDLQTGGVRVRAPVVPTSTGRQQPGGRPSVVFDAGAVSVLRVVDEGRVTTESTLSPATPTVGVRVSGTCGGGTGGCGVRRDALVLVGDATGRTDFLQVSHVDAGTVTFVAWPRGASLPVYAPGSSLAVVETRSYVFDPVRRQLRSRRDGGAIVPMLDGVVDLRFRYFGVDVGQARTLELSPDILTDGPWRGGVYGFDVDLLRVRRIRVDLRLETTSRDGSVPSPELSFAFDLALRVPWRR